MVAVIPGESGAEHFLIHIGAAHIDFPDVAPVAVSVLHLHTDVLFERELAEVLAGLAGELLSPFRGIYAVESHPNLLSFAVRNEFQRVSILHIGAFTC